MSDEESVLPPPDEITTPTVFNTEAAPVDDTQGYSLFVVDTETTGIPGTTPWADSHKIIELACYHPASNSNFLKRIKAEGVRFQPKENEEIHKITFADLAENGKDLREVLEEFSAWVAERSQGKTPLMLAHNAPFDRDIIMAAYTKVMKRHYGIGFHLHPWQWLCSLLAARKLHPDLHKEYFPEERPYSLETLMAHFFPHIDMGQAHNAIVDVRALNLVFSHHIYPLLHELHGPGWRSCPFILSNAQPSVLCNVAEIPYIRRVHVTELWKAIQETFHSSQKWQKYAFPKPAFCAFYLQMYAKLRLELVYHTRGTLEEFPDEGFAICREIEDLCRDKGIHSDAAIAKIVGYALGATGLDLAMNTCRLDVKQPYFPTRPGEPASYRPLPMTVAGGRILKEMGHRTLNEVYLWYEYTPEAQRFETLERIRGFLSRDLSHREIEDALFLARDEIKSKKRDEEAKKKNNEE